MSEKTHTSKLDKVADTIRAAKGNVSQEHKDLIAHWWVSNSQGQGFGRSVCEKLEVTDMQVFDNPEVPGKKETRMLFEIEVQRGASQLLRLPRCTTNDGSKQTCAIIWELCMEDAYHS